jgi:hypothetical protein
MFLLETEPLAPASAVFSLVINNAQAMELLPPCYYWKQSQLPLPVQCSALCSVQPTQLVSIRMCGTSARFVHPKQLFWESKYNLHHLLGILSRTSACAD